MLTAWKNILNSVISCDIVLTWHHQWESVLQWTLRTLYCPFNSAVSCTTARDKFAEKWKYIARDDHLEISKIPLTMSWWKEKKKWCAEFLNAVQPGYLWCYLLQTAGALRKPQMYRLVVFCTHLGQPACWAPSGKKKERMCTLLHEHCELLYEHIYIKSEIIQAKGASTSSPMYMSKQTCLLSPFKKKRKTNIDYHVVPSQC